MSNKRLESERIVTSAPMSFTGSARRIWRALGTPALQWSIGPMLLLLAWPCIAIWYVIFGIFLVPYRLVRRGSRNRKVADARHREMLAQVQQNQL